MSVVIALDTLVEVRKARRRRFDDLLNDLELLNIRDESRIRSSSIYSLRLPTGRFSH